MDWKIEYLEDGDIVFVKMLNPIDLKGTVQLFIEASMFGNRQQSYKYLVDHRGVDVVLSVLDIDKVPDRFREIDDDFNGKTALLVDAGGPKNNLFEFLTNVLALQSMEMRLFYDEDEALAWLKSV